MGCQHMRAYTEVKFHIQIKYAEDVVDLGQPFAMDYG